MKYLLVLLSLLVLSSISFVNAEITYEISWEEENIVNGDEFKIQVVIDGEDDELYDGKLWIENKGKIISDRYDDKKGEWKSSYYYIKEYFVDGDNEVKLDIDEKFEDFEGSAFIHFRIRDEEEIREEIVVLEKKEENKEDIESVQNENQEEPLPNEEYVDTKTEVEILEPISLGNKVATVEEKDINTERIVYESKGTKIIGYSIYGFVILCVLLCVLIIWRKLD